MVDVYTMSWDGEYEPGLAVRTIAAKGFRNHTRRQDFVRQIQPYLSQGHYELIVGFNKMPRLDVYYAADTCYQAKARRQRSWWYRLTGRYRRTKAYEEAVFLPTAKAEILLLSAPQQAEFMHYYHTPEKRFHLLPPGIDRDRILPENATEIRADLRNDYQIADDQFLILMVGSGFKTKGLDRALLAFAAMPQALQDRSRLVIIGKDNEAPFLRLANKLGIAAGLGLTGANDRCMRLCALCARGRGGCGDHIPISAGSAE
jgi:UDP-glucose:(heptosyl)LPS alpha-1,3-glucosyltransferase